MQEFLSQFAATVGTAPPVLTLLLVFLGGIVSSASPCVLVAIPLIMATVGGASTSRRRALALSSAFALGLAISFTALGALAAITGSLLGDIGVGWQILLGIVLIVMGLHLTGLIHLPLPQIDGRRFRNAGLPGAFVLGALTGTLSSPCATPILVVILSLVAFERKILWGTTLLAAYSLGHVLLLFAAGAVTGFASAYLKSRTARLAAWTHRAFGVALMGIGAWILVAPVTTLVGK